MIVGWVHLVRRPDARQGVHYDPARRIIEASGTDQPIEPRGLEDGPGPPFSNRLPESSERLSGTFVTAEYEPVGGDHSVHRPGTRSHDSLDDNAFVLKNLVERSPGESAMRSASLQGEVN